ncbi:hypothetical protein GF312_05405 [Candidatus Poribacteria bacterium]|nr:hypothetical protein [Candidatus Poribacteria bacterium]
MLEIPRTQIENLSVPRLMAGTNWFLGYSHTSAAKDKLIKEMQTRQHLADILEVFFNAGVDAVYGGRPGAKHLTDAMKDAEDRTGRKCVRIGIPSFNTSGTQEATDANLKLMDEFMELDYDILMPHQNTTDVLVDKRTRTIRDIDFYVSAIRERGMIPGLSTHMPETPIYADEMGLDLGTYIQIYNAAGFLMQIEIDWVHRMIWNRKKPVITIKPLAAGRLHPLVGLAFSWATLRDIDMICIGCLTPDEAKEVIDISLSLLEKRSTTVKLQETRSKASVKENTDTG